MKAYQIQAFGYEGFQLSDVPEPELGPTQVRVAVKAASINYRDLLMMQGRYNPKMRLPHIPLSDGAGEIIEIGAEVSTLKVGNRVAGAYFQRWLDGPLTKEKSRSSLGWPRPGMLAEQVVLEEAGAVLLARRTQFRRGSDPPMRRYHGLERSLRRDSNPSRSDRARARHGRSFALCTAICRGCRSSGGCDIE